VKRLGSVSFFDPREGWSRSHQVGLCGRSSPVEKE
jgi:hypothetical protein